MRDTDSAESFPMRPGATSAAIKPSRFNRKRTSSALTKRLQKTPAQPVTSDAASDESFPMRPGAKSAAIPRDAFGRKRLPKAPTQPAEEITMPNLGNPIQRGQPNGKRSPPAHRGRSREHRCSSEAMAAEQDYQRSRESDVASSSRDRREQSKLRVTNEIHRRRSEWDTYCAHRGRAENGSYYF